MAIGNAPSVAQLNSQAAQVALQLRSACQQALALQAYVVSLGQAGLVSLGFTSADATAMLNQCSYMATVAGVFTGTATQGSMFNFQNALVALTGPA
jgi:hypothetical protein